jgi:hypothetical protein
MKNLPSFLSFLPLYLLSFCILILLISPVQAKKRCKPLLEKLHNVQAMQRNGYSLKRGQSLRAKEDKARDKWWKCEHSSRYTKISSNKAKKKSKKKGKNLSKRKQVAANKSSPLYLPKKGASAPFNSSGAIVIRSKFQGDKKFAWLAFYQQPVECQRPRNLTIFATCSEDRQAQQLLFDQQYVEQ